jgi:hypothetical protein
MKTKNLILILLISFGISCGGKSEKLTTESNSTAQPVQITFFSGDAKVVHKNVETKPELGMSLDSDDVILTGENGNIEILVRESGLVKIAKNSSVMVSSFSRDSEISDTNVHINYGKIVTVVRKEKKNENYNVVTPTLVAGVRGTSFMTSVENPNANGQSIACAKEECIVKVSVLEGAVAVHRVDSPEEVFLGKGSEVTVPGSKKLNQELVKPLGNKSLEELKGSIVFHKSRIGGFENLVDELKKGSSELSKLDSSGSLKEAKSELQKAAASKSSDEILKTAKQADETKYLKKDISKEKLKLNPKETF